MSAKPSPAGTTVAAAVIDFIVSGFFLLGALLLAFFTLALGRTTFDLPDPFRGGTGLVIGFLLTAAFLVCALAVFTIILGIQILRRKSWARWTAVVIFSLFALGSLLGLASDSVNSTRNVDFAELGDTRAAERGRGGVLFLLIPNGLVVLLLVLPPTSRAFRAVAEGTTADSEPAELPPTP